MVADYELVSYIFQGDNFTRHQGLQEGNVNIGSKREESYPISSINLSWNQRISGMYIGYSS